MKAPSKRCLKSSYSLFYKNEMKLNAIYSHWRNTRIFEIAGNRKSKKRVFFFFRKYKWYNNYAKKIFFEICEVDVRNRTDLTWTDPRRLFFTLEIPGDSRIFFKSFFFSKKIDLAGTGETRADVRIWKPRIVRPWHQVVFWSSKINEFLLFIDTVGSVVFERRDRENSPIFTILFFFLNISIFFKPAVKRQEKGFFFFFSSPRLSLGHPVVLIEFTRIKIMTPTKE